MGSGKLEDHLNMMHGILTAGVFMIALFAVSGQGACEAPAIIAHRGASARAPENTRASVLLAWEMGADAVEIDIHLTADQRIVAIHDANAKRTAGADLEIARTSAATLRELDAGSFKSPEYAGEKIPFFEEIIATIPDNRRLVVEIKCGEEIFPLLTRVVQDSGRRGRFIFIGFGFEVMRRCKVLMPDIPAYWLCAVNASDSAGITLLQSGDFQASIPEALDEVKKAGLDGVNVAHAGVDASLVEMVRSKGLDILVLTVNDPARASQLAAMGIRAITTDMPDLMLEKR